MRFAAWLVDERGGIGDFLIGATLMAFVAFFPLEIAVPLQRVWALQHIKAMLLEQITWEGQVPPDILSRVQSAASAFPFLDPSKVQVGPRTTTPGQQVAFGQPITLQIGHPQGSVWVARFVGLNWDPNRMIWVQGTVLSQRPWR